MKLKNLVKKYHAEWVAIYTGSKVVYPEYADELLETHGEEIVKEHAFKDNVLIVVF